MSDPITLEEAMAAALRGVDRLDDENARRRAYLAAGIETQLVAPEHADAADERARSIVLIERMNS